MSTNPPTAGLHLRPEPSQGRQDTRADSTSASTSTSAALRFLELVRWIIGYGQELTALIQRGLPDERLATLAHRLHTGDLAILLARVTRGLMLAAGLETKLRDYVASGRDVAQAPLRSLSQGGGGGGGSTRRPRTPNVIDLPLDRLPTAEQIAAELQRRPVGAIIVDICRDLGIRPGDLPRELRQLLSVELIFHGGQLAVLLFKEDDIWVRSMAGLDPAARDAAVIADCMYFSTPESTGPP